MHDDRIKLDFFRNSEDGSITGFNLVCFGIDDTDEGERKSSISIDYDAWMGPEDKDDPKLVELAAKHGPKRLTILINGNDDLIYLSEHTVKAMMAIFQQFIR